MEVFPSGLNLSSQVEDSAFKDNAKVLCENVPCLKLDGSQRHISHLFPTAHWTSASRRNQEKGKVQNGNHFTLNGKQLFGHVSIAMIICKSPDKYRLRLSIPSNWLLFQRGAPPSFGSSCWTSSRTKTPVPGTSSGLSGRRASSNWSTRRPCPSCGGNIRTNQT